MEKELPCKCGSVMIQEDRNEQFERIRVGIKDIFPYESDVRIVEFTRNYMGYGPNYMFRCPGCGRLIKFIPDGRKREL
jgi:methyl coenzyme M reductase subunit D